MDEETQDQGLETVPDAERAVPSDVISPPDLGAPPPPPAYQPPPPAYQPPPPPYPQQPGYQQPYAGQAVPTSDKSKVAAGILGILLGPLGVHKFYLGYTKEGVIMLLVSLLTFGLAAGIVGVIGLIEGIVYLTKSDEEFYYTYVAGRKGWF